MEIGRNVASLLRHWLGFRSELANDMPQLSRLERISEKVSTSPLFFLISPSTFVVFVMFLHLPMIHSSALKRQDCEQSTYIG